MTPELGTGFIMGTSFGLLTALVLWYYSYWRKMKQEIRGAGK